MIPRKLAPADYDSLMGLQGGRCAICRQPPEKGRRLAVDHCHQEDFVRGLLCNRCNLGQGFMEDPDLRARALAYLERARIFANARRNRGLVWIDVLDFLDMEFPKEDWRSALDPFRQELLLQSEVETLCWFRKLTPGQVAKQLGISHARVLRLLRGELRHDGPVYYKASEVLWPDAATGEPS